MFVEMKGLFQMQTIPFPVHRLDKVFLNYALHTR